jgi:hypothetical protein
MQPHAWSAAPTPASSNRLELSRPNWPIRTPFLPHESRLMAHPESAIRRQVSAVPGSRCVIRAALLRDNPYPPYGRLRLQSMPAAAGKYGSLWLLVGS